MPIVNKDIAASLVPTPATGYLTIFSDAQVLKAKDDTGTVVSFGAGGTVSSVAVSGSNGISVSGSPITTSGTIALSLGAITPTSVNASGTVLGSNLSGTNTGDQTITLTGDVIGSGTGSFAATISSSAVTNAKLANMAAHTFKGNKTGSAAAPTDLTAADLTAELNIFSSSLQGVVPASGGGTSNYLRADGTWAAPPAGTGTVTAVSVVSANGFAGSSSGGATPALTISTSITGLLKGNGTAISAASAGTDYLAPPSGTALLKANSGGALANATAGTDYSTGTSALATGILKSTTSTGALSIAVAADFPTLNQNTTGTASNVTGTVTIANGGTGQTTAANAINALLPSQTSNAGKVLGTNGTVASWVTAALVAPNYEEYVATAGQTVINTTMGTTAKTGGKAYLQVYVNGILYMEGSTKRFTVTGANQITFNSGLALNDDVAIFGYA